MTDSMGFYKWIFLHVIPACIIGSWTDRAEFIGPFRRDGDPIKQIRPKQGFLSQNVRLFDESNETNGNQ